MKQPATNIACIVVAFTGLAALLQAAGVPATSFGNSTGPIKGLLNT